MLAQSNTKGYPTFVAHPDEERVSDANRAFYDAFRQRDDVAMNRLWATCTVVCCIHPGWDVLEGREAVMASWKAIFGASRLPDVHCSDETVQVLGTTAVVTCVEHFNERELIATNVFVHEGDTWRLVHHHSGPIAQDSRRPGSPGDELN